MTTWLTKVFDFNVERREIPRAGGKLYRPMGRTQIGVLHTTEGPGVDSAWSTLKNNPGGPSAPHFIVGQNRIVQCRPIGVQAAALKGSATSNGNQFASVQVEMCAFTGGNSNFQKHGMDPWLPEDSTLKPLAALMAYCSANGIDIPLARPHANWKDDCSDITTIWATDKNTRRLSGVWPTAKGWYYHLEVPGNNHYDCGAMRSAELFAMAKALADTAPQPAQPATPQPATPQPAVSQPATPQPATPQPAAPEAAPASAILKQGDHGDRVKQLQVKLIALGLLKAGSDTGNFGPHTLDAVRRFQSAHGLGVDGKVGSTTDNAIGDAVAGAGK